MSDDVFEYCYNAALRARRASKILQDPFVDPNMTIKDAWKQAR